MNKKILAILIVAIFAFELFSVSFSSAAAASPIDKVVFVTNNANNGAGKPSSQNIGSYKLMGVSWAADKLPVQFEINPKNPDGLNSADVKVAILIAAEEWDSGAYSQSQGYSWTGTAANLFADYTVSQVPITIVTSATNNGHNEIMWSYLGNQGTIAMTTVWYNRFTRQIVEFDLQFNTYYKWSTSGASDSMDLENIATHELGHSVGLSDLYKPTATQETMYGYSDYGVTSARDLYLGDQAGITKLYG